MKNKRLTAMEKMAQGKAITCGVWPYLCGARLTCRGYEELVRTGHKCSLYHGALSLRKGKKYALIGMTPTLKKKLQAEVANA
ncbi:hypothetical protein LCGC14_0637500 [marine sediment metagenome]|uniref:Uncharacterized protein n=1 Tax=marine sediment metagenome TaxID=412755 RepID=A0A0F9R5D9_9ZZZZ